MPQSKRSRRNARHDISTATKQRERRVLEIEMKYFGRVCDNRSSFLTGVIADIMHYAYHYHLDFDQHLSRARVHFAAETGTELED